MQKPETKLVRECIAWVKNNGGTAHHVHGSAVQRAGEPDIDGAIRLESGEVVHFKIEVKVGSNQPSKLQLARLRKYAQLGFTTGVVWSLQEFIDLVATGRRLRESI